MPTDADGCTASAGDLTHLSPPFVRRTTEDIRKMRQEVQLDLHGSSYLAQKSLSRASKTSSPKLEAWDPHRQTKGPRAACFLRKRPGYTALKGPILKQKLVRSEAMKISHEQLFLGLDFWMIVDVTRVGLKMVKLFHKKKN